MTKFEELRGAAFKVTYWNVYDNVKRMLVTFDRLVDCDEMLEAVYYFFGVDNMIQDAAIQGWIDFYNNEGDEN